MTDLVAEARALLDGRDRALKEAQDGGSLDHYLSEADVYENWHDANIRALLDKCEALQEQLAAREHNNVVLADALRREAVKCEALQRERDGWQQHAGETHRNLSEVIDDYRRLTRELDAAISGEAGAAKQASLCDLISPARDLRAERDALQRKLDGLSENSK